MRGITFVALVAGLLLIIGVQYRVTNDRISSLTTQLIDAQSKCSDLTSRADIYQKDFTNLLKVVEELRQADQALIQAANRAIALDRLQIRALEDSYGRKWEKWLKEYNAEVTALAKQAAKSTQTTPAPSM